MKWHDTWDLLQNNPAVVKGGIGEGSVERSNRIGHRLTKLSKA